MKTPVSKIVVLTLKMLDGMKPCDSNPRQLRFESAIDRSYRAVGWFPKTDELTGTIDRPVVSVNGRIVRGLSRLGTIILGLKSDNEKTAKFYRDFVSTGRIEILQIPNNLPMNVLRKISSDSDSTKKSWNRAEAFRQWRLFVEEDGISPTVASMLVGFTSRRQTFEELLVCDSGLRDSWVAYAGNEENAKPVKDSEIAHAAKIARAYRAMNPSAKATDFGTEYVEYVESVMTGNKPTVAKLTATRAEIQEASSMIRTLKRSFTSNDIADMLLTLAGFNGDKMIDAPNKYFARYVRRLVNADIAVGKPVAKK